eukprot:356802-Chlamydomonas_euryale.AAC.1
MDCTFILPIFSYGCETWTLTEAQMGRFEVTLSNCLRRIVDVKLTDRHRHETVRVRSLRLEKPV